MGGVDENMAEIKALPCIAGETTGVQRDWGPERLGSRERHASSWAWGKKSRTELSQPFRTPFCDEVSQLPQNIPGRADLSPVAHFHRIREVPELPHSLLLPRPGARGVSFPGGPVRKCLQTAFVSGAAHSFQTAQR